MPESAGKSIAEIVEALQAGTAGGLLPCKLTHPAPVVGHAPKLTELVNDATLRDAEVYRTLTEHPDRYPPCAAFVLNSSGMFYQVFTISPLARLRGDGDIRESDQLYHAITVANGGGYILEQERSRLAKKEEEMRLAKVRA